MLWIREHLSNRKQPVLNVGFSDSQKCGSKVLPEPLQGPAAETGKETEETKQCLWRLNYS